MSLADEFGRRLFMARRHLGVSQETLAKMAGLHRETIYMLESGKRAPHLETLVRHCDALGAEPNQLVKGLRP